MKSIKKNRSWKRKLSCLFGWCKLPTKEVRSLIVPPLIYLLFACNPGNVLSTHSNSFAAFVKMMVAPVFGCGGGCYRRWWLGGGDEDDGGCWPMVAWRRWWHNGAGNCHGADDDAWCRAVLMTRAKRWWIMDFENNQNSTSLFWILSIAL